MLSRLAAWLGSWRVPLPFTGNSLCLLPTLEFLFSESNVFCLFCLLFLFVWWSISSNSFLRNGAREVNFLRPCMSKNIFILPSGLIDSLAGYLILGWKFFSFGNLRVFPFSLSLSCVAMENFSDILICRLLYVITLSLSLWKHFRISLFPSALVGIIFHSWCCALRTPLQSRSSWPLAPVFACSFLSFWATPLWLVLWFSNLYFLSSYPTFKRIF